MKKVKRFIAVMVSTVMLLMLSAYFPVSAYQSAYPVPNLTGNQREDIVNIALSQKGYKQNGGTVYGAWYDSIKGTNFTNSSWCAMFVSWCANQAGIDQNVLTYRSFVPDMVSDFKNKGQWHDRNYTPSRGDIIIVNSSGHVGIVTGVSGNTVYTIEGNKSSLGNACGTGSYQIGSSYITGYGVPNYGGGTVEQDPYPAYIDVNISAGTSNTLSKFYWDESKGANNYYLRIWDSTGTKEVVSVWGTDGKLSWDLQLDAGEYTAQVGAISANNSDFVKWSSLKPFTVEYDPYPAYINVNISAGTSNTLSKFYWDESRGANNYYLRIWDSTGTKEIVSVWGTDGKLSWDLQLDAGEYTAQVGAISADNSNFVNWSSLKPFTVEYDPYPAYINVNISAGTSNTLSKFYWDESIGANNYYLRIWDSTGTKEVVSIWGTNGKLSWDLQLDAGEYTAQVGAISADNSDFVNWSSLKPFTVESNGILLGNINQDSLLNMTDAVLLQKHLLNFKKLTTEQMKLADINSDGRVNILDMSLLKEKLK